MNKVFKQRFDEIEAQAIQVEASRETHHNDMFGSNEYIDDDLLLDWKVKVKNLLLKVCGKESQHLQQFEKDEEVIGYATNYRAFKRLKAIFLAAKEDFEGGHLSSMKTLV